MKPLVFLLWLVSGLYFGIAGLTRARLDDDLAELTQKREILEKQTLVPSVTVDKLEFDNKYELDYYLARRYVEKVFPWVVNISSFMSLLLTSFSFGLIGALIHLLKEIALLDKKAESLPIYSFPLLGMFSGLIVLALSFLLPTVLVKSATSSTEVRPITLMFLCLFGGIFVRTLHEKLSTYFNKLFI